MPRLLGESQAIAAVREQIERLLRRPSTRARRLPPILVLGETGTGKGLVASVLHRAGPRAGGPFVDVNCAAIPETLLEAELFGYERGAFTDARQAKPGLFQAAHGGVLFLDEVGLLPEGLQAKLLKVLEEQTVRRLGSTRAEPADVWVIAATSEDLRATARARRFREDLYHRLAVVTIALPPLRERGGDVEGLADHFLARACEEYGLPPKVLTADARAALWGYGWPGNVRELANVMERVALLVEERDVTAAALALPSASRRAGSQTRAAGPNPAVPAVEVGSDVTGEREAARVAAAGHERDRLLEALRGTGWNVSRAAARLGMARNSFRYRMDKHGLASGGGRRPSEPGPVPPPAATDSESPVGLPPPERHPGRRSIRWETRRVTLLRARLAGTVTGSPPTETGRALDAILDKVWGFGGHVHELSTSGMVAAFGLEPLEDAPRHAAYAALAIRQLAERARRDDPARSAVTLAVHAELLPVGRAGDRIEIDAESGRSARAVLDALGHEAQPGTILASPQAAVLLARGFQLVPAGPVAGLAGEAYQLLGPAEADRGAGGFVGRAAELRLLLDRFRLAEVGQGQVVSLVGEAGIGKSRLLRELRRELGAGALWAEGQAISFGRAMPFHPLVDLLRRAFAIDEGDPEPVVVDKVERAVGRFGEDLRSVLPFLRHLLGVDPGDPALLQMDPKLRRAETFDAARRLFLRAAEARPLVVVWEDLHWTDQATEEFVALLADALPTRRVLMVLTYRPGYTPPVGDRSFHTRLPLTALSTAESVAVARGLLGVAELPAALETLVVPKAEGNPFFVEELVRALRDSGAIRREGDRLVLTRQLDEGVVPDTIQDVILARIERLETALHDGLEHAAVIGREFTRRLLDRLAAAREDAERLLHELKAVELIYEKSSFPETAYTFKHALIHEVTYQSIPAARRRELHALVGRAMEELYADRLAEHSAVLAHHFSLAQDWPRALAYFQRAAETAVQGFAVREALAFYDAALDAARRQPDGPDPATVMAIGQTRASLYFALSEFDRSRAEAERVLALAREAGNRDHEARALATIAWAATWARDLDGAVTAARQAIAVAAPGGSAQALGRAYFTIGFVRAVSGGLEEAREAVDRALVISRSADDAAYRSLALSTAGLLKSWEGEYGAAVEVQDEGLVLARERGLLVPLLFSFFLRGLTLTAKGDYDAAYAGFQEGLALAEKVGDEAIHHRLLNCLAWLLAELGDLDQAIDLNRQSAEVGRRRRDPGTLPNAEVNLGDLYLGKGDLGLAAELFDSAYRFWDAPDASPWMRWRYSMRLFASLGELWLARGEPRRAREFAERCLELATRTGSRKNLVKGWRLLGRIAVARGEPDDAEDALRRALAIAQAIGNPPQLWATHAAIGDLHAARHRPEAARVAYRAACGVVDQVRAGLSDPRLRAALERASFVRELTAQAASPA